MKKQHIVLASGLILVVVFGVASFGYKYQRTEEVVAKVKSSASPLFRRDANTLGPHSAKVHIVEFLDPGCETCRKFHPFVKSLLAQHEGKVKLTVRYLPLHVGADVMAKILEAARRQDRYWQTLEVMFATQPEWASHHHPEPDKIWQFLPEAGLDLELVQRDMQDPAIAAAIQRDMADARSLNVRKTPSFFVNGEPLRDFGYDELRALVDKAVVASY